MKVLGLESSGKIASVAIVENGIVLAEYTLNAGITHSQTFLPMIDSMLMQSGIGIEQIDVMAVSQGPGSYTGLRIGIATAKGLALAKQKRVVPISTLKGLAQNISDFNGRVYPVLFARSRELYFASYQMDSGSPKEVDSPQVLLMEEVLDKMKEARQCGEKIAILGDGFFQFEEEFRSVLGEDIFIPQTVRHQLSAASIAILGERESDQSIEGEELLPVYLKKTQAERECGE